MSQHVPAWKKIGLKLKYAKETAEDAPAALSATNGSSKRPREDENEQDSGSAPKRNKQSNREIRTESPAPRSILSGSQSPTKTPANKKAVSFSAETKGEDGETGQNYFKAWAAGNSQPHTPPKPSTETVLPETPESVEEQAASTEEAQETPTEIKAKSKASKRDKKADQAAAQTQHPDVEGLPSLQERRDSKAAKKAAKQALKAQSQPAALPSDKAPTSAYVEYLHQFAHDKPNWKFNKSKENHLLKSLWSLFRVPAEYTPAIVDYIAGLQGAGARVRLVQGADEVLKDVAEKGGQKFDFNGYEENETRREAYTASIRQQKEKEALSQEDVERAERAEAVLTQLLHHAPVPVPMAKPKPAPAPAHVPAPAVRPTKGAHEKPTSGAAGPGGQRIQFDDVEKRRIQFDDDDDDEPAPAPAVKAKQPARRKRKARTEVSSDESSSDSSSSDSSSDSDSD